MNKGYQVIEPPALDALVVNPNTFDVTVAVLSWLVELVRTELNDQLDGAEIDLIRVEYHGAYPAFGIHYARPEREDLGPLVEMTIANLLQKRTAADFVSWVARTNADWRKVTDDLLAPLP